MNNSTLQLDIEKIISESQRDIRDQVISDAKKSFSQQIGWALESKIKEGVDEFYAEEILPALREQLFELKPEILQSLKLGILQSAEAVGKALYEKASKNLSESWQATKVVEALFK